MEDGRLARPAGRDARPPLSYGTVTVTFAVVRPYWLVA
jgi:hypothetical protein